MNVQGLLEFFKRRRRDYHITYDNPAGRRTLADIQDFCCADRTTAASGSTPHDMAIREGRRQVWLRIQRALNLTPEEMYSISLQKDQPQ